MTLAASIGARQRSPLSARLVALLSSAMPFVLAACVASRAHAGVERSDVIGGTEAGLADEPATGALVRSLPAGSTELICTGTLIGPRTVLTAAHCIVLIGGEVPDFSLATVAAAAYSGAVYHGLHAQVHPDFAIGTADGLRHDLAILELAEDVVGVAPARLPEAEDVASLLVPGSPVILAGYGATDDDGTNEGVKNVGMASIVRITADELVIGAAGTVRNCTGDSGGPSLAHTSPAGTWLLGITSRSLVDDAPCAGSAVHTRVDAHMPWIDDVLTEIDRPSGGCSVAGTSRSRSGTWLLTVVLGATGTLRRRRRRSQG